MILAKPKITLFWKILLWFWFMFAIVILINLFMTQISNENTRYRKLPPHLYKQLDNIRMKMTQAFKQKRLRLPPGRRLLKNVFVLDINGVDYFSRAVPEMLKLLDQRVDKNNRPMSAFKKQILYFGGIKIKINNTEYRLYHSQTFTIFSRGYFSVLIREFAHNLLISIFLVSFPLSFLLAWFITRPIKKLQTALSEFTKDIKSRESIKTLSNRSDEFGDLAKDFDIMANHIEMAITSKDRLLSDVSHELKSPLARLQVSLGLAYKNHPKEAHTELDRIKLEADRMSDMITGLLEYSKLENNNFQPAKQTTDLTTLIKTIINNAEFEGKDKGISFETELEEGIEYSAYRSMLVSCFDNIIRNAIRYANQKIVVSCIYDSKKSYILITIIDDGDGVPNDQLDKIFDAFYRPETDRSRLSGGVGLGLSIAKKAVDAHDGNIVAENIEPNGLALRIRLPI